MSGQVGYYSGLAAEDIVARAYKDLVYAEAMRRWRGPGGEIDLILTQDKQTVFVEVKKSNGFADAAARVSARQLQRIETSAAEFLARCPQGSNSDARIDVALVNRVGAVEIIENVTMH